MFKCSRVLRVHKNLTSLLVQPSSLTCSQRLKRDLQWSNQFSCFSNHPFSENRQADANFCKSRFMINLLLHIGFSLGWFIYWSFTFDVTVESIYSIGMETLQHPTWVWQQKRWFKTHIHSHFLQQNRWNFNQHVKGK